MNQKMNQLGVESKALIKIIDMKNNELLSSYRDYSKVNAVLEALISIFQKQSQDFEKLKAIHSELHSDLAVFNFISNEIFYS